MDKDRILDEIKRTAVANGGVPLGWRRFEEETGIKYYDWYGKHWTRWSDAVREAGFSPNKMSEPYSSEVRCSASLGPKRNVPRAVGVVRFDRWDIWPYADVIMKLHVPPDLEAMLNRLAAETGREAEQLALDLLASSIEHDQWFRREVEKGRISAREHRLLDRDELLARIEKRYRA